MYLYDDFLWDFDGFARRPYNLQPEKKKGKYVKSGKYAKKKDVALKEHEQNTQVSEQKQC